MASITIGVPPNAPRQLPFGPITTGQTLSKFWAHAYVRSGWTGIWTRLPYVKPLRSSEAAWPERSIAEFQFDYGEIKREDRSDYPLWIPEAGLDMYICIRVVPETGTPYISWVGVVPMETLDIFGTQGSLSAATYPAGIQQFVAYGLDYLLERRQIAGAYARQTDGSAVQIGYAPRFNERLRSGLQLVGNRSAEKITVDSTEVCYGFGGRNTWSHRDILEYLLYYSNDTVVEPEFVLGPPAIDGADDPEILTFADSLVSTVSQSGINVKAIIDELITRRRGLGARLCWSVLGSSAPQGEAGFPGGPVELELLSMVDVPVTAGDTTLPANPYPEYLRLDSGIDTEASIVTIDALATYDRLRVQGARTLTCFSAVTASETNWPMDHAIIERAWSAAEQSAYDALDDSARGATAYERVYARFRLPADWNWQTVYGQRLNPSFDRGAWLYEHRALANMPPQGTRGGMFTPLDREMAFELRYNPAHYLAKNHFTGASEETKLDYDQMIATICLETDTRPSVDVILDTPGIGRNRMLTITLDDVEVWLIANGTVVGITDTGGLEIYQGPRVLRDDTYRLRATAALAMAIYNKHRRAVRVRTRGVTLGYPVGTFILGAWVDQVRHDVGSVVTQRIHDYERMTTEVVTGFVELDVRRMR